MSNRYYSPLRPLSLGTFPKPQGNEILHIENFEERRNVPEAAGYELLPSNWICEMENIEARR